MLERLKAMFRSDDVISTLSVFPEIDEEKIQRELALESQGRDRGARNQPEPSAQEPDHIETAIITRIEALRRTGLENYEQYRRVYNERLARAGDAKKEVEIVAGRARNEFGASVQGWKTTMTPTIERLNETYTYRRHFRDRHRLIRPARQFEGWVKFAALAVIYIVIESAMNSFMFSRGNESGLLGGLLTAFIFSALNVLVSILMGYFARYVNHTNLLKKLFGLLVILAWIGFAVALNLMIAHFRDLIDAGATWEAALRQAVPNLTAGPVALTGMDSWILVGIGGFISTLAFLKGWTAEDPFPGYSQVEGELARARRRHEIDMTRALDELTDRRDEAIEELRDADRQVRDGITEAIDALFGQSALNAHLETFLEQCDLKLAHLLAVYRDANRNARTEPAPPSFARVHRFAAFTPARIEDGRKTNAEAEAAKVTETVDAAIADIFAQFETARREFRLPEEIQRGDHLAAGRA